MLNTIIHILITTAFTIVGVVVLVALYIDMKQIARDIKNSK